MKSTRSCRGFCPVFLIETPFRLRVGFVALCQMRAIAVAFILVGMLQPVCARDYPRHGWQRAPG